MIHKKRSRAEITSQTGMRGVAVLIVMLAHFMLIKTGPEETTRLLDLYPKSGSCIDMFFLISGFIMAYIYADFFSGGIKKDAVKKFYWVRIIRLYPMHIFALAMFMILRLGQVVLADYGPSGFTQGGDVTFFTDDDTPYTLLANLLLIHAWGVTSELSWNYPSWALSAEWGAYMTFPFLCLFVGRFPRVAPFVVLVASLLGYYAIDLAYGHLNVPGHLGVLRCIPGFALGLSLYHLSSPMRHLSDAQVQAAQTVTAIALVLAFIYTDQMVILLLIAAMVIVTSENRGWFSAAWSWQPFRFLGEISYSIYLMHIVAGTLVSPFLRVAGRVTGFGEEIWWAAPEIVVKMAAAIVLSALTYRYVEIPAREYLDALRKRRRAQAMPAASPELVPVPAPAQAQARPEQHGA